jgi:hypothetical protein
LQLRNEIVVRSDIHEWEDYFRIDVGRYVGDINLIRKLKHQSVEQLLDIFDGWRQSTNTFNQDLAIEMKDAGRAYLDSYFQYLSRFTDENDYDVFLERPIMSMVVEHMLFCFSNETQLEECLRTCSISTLTT